MGINEITKKMKEALKNTVYKTKPSKKAVDDFVHDNPEIVEYLDKKRSKELLEELQIEAENLHPILGKPIFEAINVIQRLRKEKDEWQRCAEQNVPLDLITKCKRLEKALEYHERFYKTTKATYPKESRIVKCALEVVDDAKRTLLGDK